MTCTPPAYGRFMPDFFSYFSRFFQFVTLKFRAFLQSGNFHFLPSPLLVEGWALASRLCGGGVNARCRSPHGGWASGAITWFFTGPNSWDCFLGLAVGRFSHPGPNRRCWERCDSPSPSRRCRQIGPWATVSHDRPRRRASCRQIDLRLFLFSLALSVHQVRCAGRCSGWSPW